MRSPASRDSVVFCVMAVFAALLLFAAFAPAALARDDSADMAGAEIYKNANEEAKFLRDRAEEFGQKAFALQLKIQNDTAKAKRLEDSAENLRGSANNAEQEMEAATEQAKIYEQLSNFIGNFAGQWECAHKLKYVPTEVMQNNKVDIDFKPMDRNGNVREYFDISPNYGYDLRAVSPYAFKAVREKELGEESYEFQVDLERSFIEIFEGKWTIFHEGDGAQISFGKNEALWEINNVSIPETTATVLSKRWLLSDKPVPGWRNIPALRNEAGQLREEADAILPASGKGKYENPRPLTRSLSWWEKHCEKVL